MPDAGARNRRWGGSYTFSPVYSEIVERARERARSVLLDSPSARRDRLREIGEVLKSRREECEEALRRDRGAPPFEAWATEIGLVLAEIRYARRRLRRWMRPRFARTPVALLPSLSWNEARPVGAVLVIAPWNYPLQLALAPAVSALAAGNAVVIKPSEFAPATAEWLRERLPAALPAGILEVVPGGPEVGEGLVEAGFDHIVFTGNRRIGARVAAAAGRRLTPVTLELGGKCPAFVDETANLKTAARRIAWAKFLNAGQTCLAPDFVLVPESRHEEFADLLAANLRRFYGDHPASSPDYARIGHRAHFDRLVGLLDGLPLRYGGETDPESLTFAPTLTGPWPPGHAAATEEIFGPLLPLLPYAALPDAYAELERHRDPLALYVFSRSAATVERAATIVRSGALAVNDAVLQCANPSLPFGGVGRSGFGAYHGRFGFERLSYRRARLSALPWFEVPVRFPPYAGKEGLIRRLLR